MIWWHFTVFTVPHFPPSGPVIAPQITAGGEKKREKTPPTFATVWAKPSQPHILRPTLCFLLSPGAAQTLAQVTVSLSRYFHISCTFQDLLPPAPALLSAAFWTLLAGSTSARRLVRISGISSWVSPPWDVRGRSGGSSADVFFEPLSGYEWATLHSGNKAFYQIFLFFF